MCVRVRVYVLLCFLFIVPVEIVSPPDDSNFIFFMSFVFFNNKKQTKNKEGNMFKNLLAVDTALGLLGAVLVLHALEPSGPLSAVAEPVLDGNLAGALHVAQGGEADVVEGVVRHVVLAQVRPAVLEGPERERVELGSLPHGQGGALEPVVPAAAVDPGLGVGLLEGSHQGLDLALLVVLVDVLHPVVFAVPAFIRLFVRSCILLFFHS